MVVNVEDVLGNRLRVKILKMLSRIGELNVSRIAKRLGVNHRTAVKHLKALESYGILQHKTFGRVSLYRFNEGSPKAKAIQDLMESWERIGDDA